MVIWTIQEILISCFCKIQYLFKKKVEANAKKKIKNHSILSSESFFWLRVTLLKHPVKIELTSDSQQND